MKLIYSVLLATVFSIYCYAQDSPTASKNGWTLHLAKTEACPECLGEARFYLGIQRSNEADGRIFPVESSAMNIKKLLIYGDFGIVWGDLPYGGDAISIIDLNTKETIEEIFGYQAQLLNDDRYLVFQKHYPRFSSDPPSQILLYDMEYALEAAALFGSQSQEEVGFTIYAKGVGSASDAVFDKVVWDNTSKLLFFTLQKGTGGLSLLIASPGATLQSLEAMEVCEIPMISGWPEDQSDGHQVRTSYQVEALNINAQVAQVTLDGPRGINGSLTVAYQYQCPPN